MRLRRGSLFLLLVGPSLAATADDSVQAPESIVSTAVVESIEVPVTNAVDRGHRWLSGYVVDAIDRVDRFLHDSVAGEDGRPSHLINRFYGDRYLRSQSSSASYITITPEVTFSEDPAVKFDLDFSARLRLRRFSDRLELFVDRFDEDEDLLDGVLGRVNRRAHDSEEEGGAGLRYRLPQYFALHSSISASMAFKPEPIPRLKLRGSVQAKPGKWRVNLNETLFWESDDGFGEKTQLELSRPLGSNTIIRSSTAAVWSETSEGVDLGQTLTWSHKLSHRRIISFRAGVAGHTEPSAVVDIYTVRAIWRQQIYRNWIYLEIEPGVDFPDDEDFDAIPLLSIRFDLILGAVAPDS